MADFHGTKKFRKKNSGTVVLPGIVLKVCLIANVLGFPGFNLLSHFSLSKDNNFNGQ